MFYLYLVIIPAGFFGEWFENAIVEYRAVLENLNE